LPTGPVRAVRAAPQSLPEICQYEASEKEKTMFELTTVDETVGLQSIAEVAELYRRRGHHRRSSRKNVCLVTANHSLNGISILNILNF